jgi:hypothetical protein
MSHILHWVAVKVDGDLALDNPIGVLKEDASLSLNSTLEGDERPYLNWTDWWMVGGGRFTEGDSYSTKHEHCIAYHEDADKFLAQMNEAIEWRKAHMTSNLAELQASDFDFVTAVEEAIEKTGALHTYGHKMWLASNLSKLAMGYWTVDTRFYDIENGLDSTEFILKDIENGLGYQWVLVPVDFHY